VFDVTGAGDTVVATLALAIAAGCDLPIAVDLSNIAAGLAVRRVGTVCIQVADLKHAWHNKHLSSSKRHGAPSQICDLSQLLSVRARARHQGHRVVMTNGCFDVLHPGHVTYLEQARALGDCLVVAVNDDASVRRLKGPSRPINALSDRLRMLGALASVDWIIPFSEDTPETLISQVLPDILVKGGDYTPAQIAGADHVLAQGGQVLVLDHVPEYSSTAAIARIGKACPAF
jgi:D-beta-D-heptose 7-phosphate kinase / D-beta-D-heptose 1-phosphate adenosyltransferase